MLQKVDSSPTIQHVPLAKLVLDVSTRSPVTKPNETFTYVDLSAVDQERKAIIGARVLVGSEAPSRARQVICTDDVLVSTVRPNLNGVAIVPQDYNDAIASTGFCVLRPNGKLLDPLFLFHWVRSPAFVSEMVRRATGASYPAVSDRIVQQSLIPYPPLPEQRRIAAILDQADALRAKRREALAKLERMTHAAFAELFGDLRTNAKQWPTVSIQEVCELIVDCVNRTAPLSEVKTPYKMVRTSNVRNGRVDLRNVRYVDKATFDRWNRRTKPRVGDVLLTREAPVGEVGIIAEPDEIFLGQRLMLYRTSPTIMLPEFLLYSFLDTFLEDQFEANGSGSTVKHLPLPACRSFQLRLPPIKLQAEFSQRLKAIRLLQDQSTHSLGELEALFFSLQHRAFSGAL